MKKNGMNVRGLVLVRYLSPEVKMVKIESRGMLCQSGSGSITDLEGKDDDPNVWE